MKQKILQTRREPENTGLLEKGSKINKLELVPERCGIVRKALRRKGWGGGNNLSKEKRRITDLVHEKDDSRFARGGSKVRATRKRARSQGEQTDEGRCREKKGMGVAVSDEERSQGLKTKTGKKGNRKRKDD